MKKMLSMILVAVGLTFGASAFAAPPPAAESGTQELAKPGKEPRAEKRAEHKDRKGHHKGRRGEHRTANRGGRKGHRHPRRG